MTTDRKDDGVRVRVKAGTRAAGRTGTALYGPYKRFGETWPGFGHGDNGWTLPVLLDGDDGPCLYSPSELEPGPPRREVRERGDRRVRRRLNPDRVGTLMEGAEVQGTRWPGFSSMGALCVPVCLDDGTTVAWRVDELEQLPLDPEPSPVQAPVGPQGGPRVRVRDRARDRDRGRVLYRAMVGGRVWPDFEWGEWRVPVRMEASGTTLFILAKDLEPLAEPESVEATILAEADKVANAIQAKALREVAGAAADALELFVSRLRNIELKGDGNAK